jgi:hypothetical protein
MFRLKTVSSLLVYGAAILVCLVFVLHFFTPSYYFSDNEANPSDHPGAGIYLFHRGWMKDESSTIGSISTASNPEINVKCRDNLVTIEQYRLRSVVRGVIVRFPSDRADYFFVQFRWFYRSWIESEMFTLDRWRTDIIILIDDEFPKETRQLLEHLNCHAENQRTSRQQISRCLLVTHKLLSQRSKAERQNYIDKYPMLNRTPEPSVNVDRIFAIHDYTSQLNNNQTIMYDFLMVTTMNTFLTTQFGKYLPLKCSFLLGASPDYSTWYAQTEQIHEFAHTLLFTLKDPFSNRTNSSIDYSLTIQTLRKSLTFIEKQVDIPCDSKVTTYRTFIYHLKCYAHSTSLFSERMFRENAYDGYDKAPFNIYIAREYASLIALQSKVMSLDDLHSLAVNVTRRAVYT